VIIALFGGMAGIIGILNKNKGNVIPGVAIATALMPPLCTAGYGLATFQLTYFFGAFYLFTINTVFIAISSVIITNILKLPVQANIDDARKKQVNRWISAIIVLVLIPSIYFGYKLVQAEVFVENSRKFVKEISIIEGNYLLNNEIDESSKTINLIYGGPSLNEEVKSKIKNRAAEYDLGNATIEFKQGIAFDEISRKSNEVDKLKLEIIRMNLIIAEKNKIIDSISTEDYTGRAILKEINTMFPSIISCSYNESSFFRDSIPQPEIIKTIIFGTGKHNLSNTDRTKIEKWSKARLNSANVKVFYDR
jgi:hypothetical protein